MGYTALVLAVCAAGLVAVPELGMYVAAGLAILAITGGAIAFRRRAAPAGQRLAGSGAIGLGAIALALATLKWALTLAALDRLADLFS